MLEAMGWALLGASSLLIGALIAFAVPGDRLLGFILAFGAGVLISAVAYELVEEAASPADRYAVAGRLRARSLGLLRRRRMDRGCLEA